MMKLKTLLFLLSLSLVFACERAEKPGEQNGTATPVSFSLETKGLPEGDHTYRVALVNVSKVLSAQGTYCSREISPGEGKEYSWLAPCGVDDDGAPVDDTGNPVNTLDDAHIDAKYGLRYNLESARSQDFYFSAVSPAVALVEDGNRAYYPWENEKVLYISETDRIYRLEGTWLNGEYVFSLTQNKEPLKLIDRRAKFSVRVYCQDQPTAYIRSIQFEYISKARWYLPEGFSTDKAHYTTEADYLYDYTEGRYNEGGQPLKLVRDNGDVLTTDKIYILPLNYSLKEYVDMQPLLTVTLGQIKPIPVPVRISQDIKPERDYVLSLEVSKNHVSFALEALPWDDGGISETPEIEEWGTIEFGDGNTEWDLPGGTIDTEDWNNQL